MFERKSESFKEIRSFLDEIPVIETHEHYIGKTEPVEDILEFLMFNYYYISDFMTASFGNEELMGIVQDRNQSFDQRWQAFEQIYQKSRHTAYAKALVRGLKECWGLEEINKTNLLELQEKMKKRDGNFYEQMMNKYKIRAAVVDIFDTPAVIEGKIDDYSKYCRFAFSLPSFHNLKTKADINQLASYLKRPIKSIDDYLEAFENLLKKAIDFGFVCFKDQSAYNRPINYSYPAKYDAEKVFNSIIANPRNSVADEEARLLDDYLFHKIMIMAAKYELPVQLHTDHMAGIRNDVTKANAAELRELLEIHHDVKFDLFHGNWPYLGDFLFLGKNYPNVYLDLCWVQAIDPLYSVELMKRAIMTVPHAKVMAFGGDTGAIEFAVGYLVLARDNTAYAFSELVDDGWISLDQAKTIAVDWFFNNPNEFFKLGLKL